MHPEAYAFVAGALAELPPRKRVVEIGSRNVNGEIRPLFRDALAYVGVDLVGGPGVDLVLDCAGPSLQVLAKITTALYAPGDHVHLRPDTVVTCEVLEHAERADRIVENALALLEPGGVLIVTCATDPRPAHSAVDGGPLRAGEFYRNVPLADLGAWARRAGGIMGSWSLHQRGDLYAVITKQ